MPDAAYYRRKAAALYKLANVTGNGMVRFAYVLQAMECEARVIFGGEPCPRCDRTPRRHC